MSKRDLGSGKPGANRSKGIREFQKQKQTERVCKQGANRSKGTREFSEEGANRSKGTRKIEIK